MNKPQKTTKTRKPHARYDELGQEVIDLFLEYVRNGYSYDEAAKKANFSPTTMRYWRRQVVGFNEEVKRAREEFFEKNQEDLKHLAHRAAHVLLHGITEEIIQETPKGVVKIKKKRTPPPQLVQFILQNTDPDRFGAHQTHDIRVATPPTIILQPHEPSDLALDTAPMESPDE